MTIKHALFFLPLLVLPLPLRAAGSIDQCTYFLQHREFNHAIDAGQKALQETDPHRHELISAAHLCLGAALKQAGQTDQALEELHKVRDLGASSADALVATTLLATLSLAGGDPELALQYYHEAARMAHDQHNRSIEAAMLRAMGNLFFGRKDASHALQYYEQSVQLGGDTDAAMMDALATLYVQKKMTAQAIQSEKRALELARQQKEPVWSGRYELALGALYRQARQFDQATPLLQQALQDARLHNDRPTQARALELQGRLALDTGQKETAAALFLQAQEAYTQIGDQYDAYQMYQQRQLLLPPKPKRKAG